jgi:hypothetical protein
MMSLFQGFEAAVVVRDIVRRVLVYSAIIVVAASLLVVCLVVGRPRHPAWHCREYPKLVRTVSADVHHMSALDAGGALWTRSLDGDPDNVLNCWVKQGVVH